MKLKSYFRSSGYLDNSLIKTDSNNELDLKNLPSFLRTLLVTDGTVTKSLEAWFWEPVIVKPQRNERSTAGQSLEGLIIKAGDPVLQREVSLCGKLSGEIFATAESTIALSYLPKDVSDALEKGIIGIGEILRDEGLETYRDIFKLNYFPLFSLSNKEREEVISRSYQIWVNSKPCIVVTEYFPIGFYKKAS